MRRLDGVNVLIVRTRKWLKRSRDMVFRKTTTYESHRGVGRHAPLLQTQMAMILASSRSDAPRASRERISSLHLCHPGLAGLHHSRQLHLGQVTPAPAMVGVRGPSQQEIDWTRASFQRQTQLGPDRVDAGLQRRFGNVSQDGNRDLQGRRRFRSGVPWKRPIPDESVRIDVCPVWPYDRPEPGTRLSE